MSNKPNVKYRQNPKYIITWEKDVYVVANDNIGTQEFNLKIQNYIWGV